MTLKQDKLRPGEISEAMAEIMKGEEKYKHSLTEANKPIAELERAAIALYDNRLNHRADNPQWNAPQDLWLALGKVLYGEVGPEGYPTKD